MTKLFKNSKKVFALVMAFAVIAMSLFVGSVVVNAEGTTSLCSGAVMFWDGTNDSRLNDQGETGTVNDPIIIDNAAELNYIANYLTGASVKDKYYKMADGISYMFLQPESVAKIDSDANGVYDILELADGNATKKYFEETITPVNWSARDTETWFANNFDGNGVTFVGMYSVSRSAGLFPTADGGASFKNFAVVNSYIHGNGGQSRTGTIVGGTCGINYGAKRQGVLNFDNVMVINNYLRAQNVDTAGGILWGACNAEETACINNAVVYGNVGVFGKANADESTFTPFVLFNGHTDALVANTVKNSIILGTTPYGKTYNKNTAGNGCFENVVTDANVAPWDNSKDYSDTELISVDGLSPYAIVETYKSMFTSFHGDLVAVTDEYTHCFECEDCGFVFYGGVAEHTWNDDHACADCGYTCMHNIGDEIFFDQNYAGDCVTEPGTLWVCNICGLRDHQVTGSAPGHTLEWVDEIIATCDNTGREGYWHCTVCNCNFTADSKEAALCAPMDQNIENPDEALFVPYAPHAAFDRTGEDETIRVVVVGNDGHYWECYTCEGKLLAVETDDIALEDKIKKHKYEGGFCVDCGWECPEHDYQPTGVVIAVGSCTADRIEELKCTNCGNVKNSTITASHKIVKVEEVKATDKLEGTKAHYTCEVCKENYTDAEGKTKATTASLVIPKVLPAEYQNIVIGSNGTLNTDTSNKSPSTSDSFASVLALAVLAGATLAFARKIK